MSLGLSASLSNMNRKLSDLGCMHAPRTCCRQQTKPCAIVQVNQQSHTFLANVLDAHAHMMLTEEGGVGKRSGLKHICLMQRFEITCPSPLLATSCLLPSEVANGLFDSFYVLTATLVHLAHLLADSVAASQTRCERPAHKGSINPVCVWLDISPCRRIWLSRPDSHHSSLI